MEVIKDFLDKHPEFSFEMYALPEGIDRDRTEYSLCIQLREIKDGTLITKCCLWCAKFEDLSTELDMLVSITEIVFNLND